MASTSASGTLFRTYSGAIGLSCRHETLRCIGLMVVSIVAYVGILVFSDQYWMISEAPFLTLGNETKLLDNNTIVKGVMKSNKHNSTIESDKIPEQDNATINYNGTRSKTKDDGTRAEELDLLTNLQLQSRFGLQGIEQRSAFDTNVTKKETVLSNGYPLSWHSCTLARQVMRKQKDHKGSPNNTLEIVILGGSLSSASGRACQTMASYDEQKLDPLSGRYSNVLQNVLDSDAEKFIRTSQSSSIDETANAAASSISNLSSTGTAPLRFNIRNMAQGGTDSVWAGLHIDKLINPLNTDVLIWEFAVNDIHPPDDPDGYKDQQRHESIKDEYSRKLDFWLRRVHSIFSLAGKPPPPILLLYTWDFGIGNKPAAYILENGLEASTLNQNTWSLIRKCQKRGWNIQVIHVGASINRTLFASDPSLLLDDLHHPGCHGIHLLADMIQYALYSNIHECHETHDKWLQNTPLEGGSDHEDVLLSPESNGILVATDPTDLTTLLFEDDIRMGSWTAWTPSIDSSSSLPIMDTSEIVYPFLQNEMPQSVSPFREDRKLSVLLPACSSDISGGSLFSLTILQSNIAWLGLDLSDPSVNLTIDNEHPRQVLPNGKEISSLDWILSWVFLWDNDTFVSRSTSNYTTISLCKTVPDRDVAFRGLVALMPKKSMPHHKAT